VTGLVHSLNKDGIWRTAALDAGDLGGWLDENLPFASGYPDRRVGVYSMREAVTPEDLSRSKRDSGAVLRNHL
jgi:hypothetical protein